MNETQTFGAGEMSNLNFATLLLILGACPANGTTVCSEHLPPRVYRWNCFSDEDILMAADRLNGRPRKKFDYHTQEELFDNFLDRVYQL